MAHNFEMGDRETDCFKYTNNDCWDDSSRCGYMGRCGDYWSPCSVLTFKQSYALEGLGEKKWLGDKPCLRDITCKNNFL